MGMVETTVLVDVSMTLTVSPDSLLTYAYVPAGLSEMAAGLLPTGIVAAMV